MVIARWPASPTDSATVRRTVALSAVLFLAVIVVGVQPVSAAGDRRIGNVESIVADRLERLGIAPDDVGEIKFSEQREIFGDEHRVTGVDAWVRLNSCPQGALIVPVRRDGVARNAYTRGMCAVPGVAQFGD